MGDDITLELAGKDLARKMLIDMRALADSEGDFHRMMAWSSITIVQELGHYCGVTVKAGYDEEMLKEAREMLVDALDGAFKAGKEEKDEGTWK